MDIIEAHAKKNRDKPVKYPTTYLQKMQGNNNEQITTVLAKLKANQISIADAAKAFQENAVCDLFVHIPHTNSLS